MGENNLQITIVIPDEFVGDYMENAFSDCFERVIADLKQKHCLAGNYELETLNMLKEAFKKSYYTDYEY